MDGATRQRMGQGEDFGVTFTLGCAFQAYAGLQIWHLAGVLAAIVSRH